jgi:hypothetical protein
MGYGLVLGLVLAGVGIGALLTAVVYLTQLKKVKADLQRVLPADSQGKLKTPPDPKDKPSRKRSA